MFSMKAKGTLQHNYQQSENLNPPAPGWMRIYRVSGIMGLFNIGGLLSSDCRSQKDIHVHGDHMLRGSSCMHRAHILGPGFR